MKIDRKAVEWWKDQLDKETPRALCPEDIRKLQGLVDKCQSDFIGAIYPKSMCRPGWWFWWKQFFSRKWKVHRWTSDWGEKFVVATRRAK